MSFNFATPLFHVFNRVQRLLALGLLLVLGACTIGPHYETPEVQIGTEFKQLNGQGEGWRPSAPQPVEKQWWQVFDDPRFESWLTELIERNASLEQAQARHRAAQAALQGARSSFWPQLGAQSSVRRSGTGRQPPETQYNVNTSVSWELDVWGRVRQQVEGSQAQLAASEADLAGVELSLISTFLQSYFQYQNTQALLQLYEQTIDIYQHSLEITKNRYAVGMVARSDVDSAVAQLENARAQHENARRQLEQLEHALVVLLGQAPSVRAFEAQSRAYSLPEMPVTIPSALLERRPDIVAAERRVAAANAEIGVAQTAWFPEFNFSLEGGYRSSSWSEWITTPARFWSLGPALALSIFDGGARRSRVEQARAQYDETAARYRETVLEALQEVEDLFSDWRSLQAEERIQQRALEAARSALRSMREQYETGLVDYLSLAQVETNTLSTEQAMLNLKNEQLQTAVRLFTALGGGWQESTGS